MTDRQGANEHLERELSVMLRRARSMSMTIAREVHEGLDAAEYSLLVLIDESGEMRAADVAERFVLDKSTVSRQLAHVEAVGLVERVPDPEDGRARLVRLTEEGRTRLERVRQQRRIRLRGALEAWPVDDVELLAQLLGRLNTSLERPGA
ncbi:MAG TPA: MarR family transcriptional regulator [Jiangellaceae bacterium]